MDTYDIVTRLIQTVVEASEKAGLYEQKAITAMNKLYEVEEELKKASTDSNPDILDVTLALLKALSEGKAIEAIRQHRILTGFGLKESKDAIEAVVNGVRSIHNWPSQDC